MRYRFLLFSTISLFIFSLIIGCSGGDISSDSNVASTSKPVISAMFPATTYAGSSAQTLTIVGSGFLSGAMVSFNGISRPATYVSNTHLTAELTTEEQAVAGTYPVTVTNPEPSSGTSSSQVFTLTSLIFGDTVIATPDWTAETHGKLKAPAITTNLSKVFDNSQVQRLDITIDASNWAVMQSNLTTLRTKLLAPNNYYLMDDPICVPGEVKYNGKEWYRVGIRYKGNSSLYGANSNKLPFKLKFNEFEDIYPAIAGQRFYGIKKLSLKSNFKDESEIHENVAAQLFRDFGLKSSHTSLCKLYVDYGSGPVYYGLYTLVEEVDDTVIKTQYADDTGNLYKPEDGAAYLSTGNFNTYEFAKKTNESALDYSDVQALYDALNSSLRLTDTATWKANLEKILDVPIFLKWLAANNVMQNWDTYGVMTHNFYLYRNPATGLFEWIPWDNNEALASNNRCLTLGASEVTSQWPLIRYLLDNADYAAQYRLNVHDFATNYFNATRMVPIYAAQSDLIREAVLSEGTGYTFTSSSKFDAAILMLKSHVALRNAAALAY
ncbi:MAG: spore coat protein [Deltaproteobacteria bacterium HGW-Deltaproteobacteria-4]|nr:MAG: spore coat protein [Deltaproteobacteria bacterium HGW-Deltaproteobacteria-4]